MDLHEEISYYNIYSYYFYSYGYSYALVGCHRESVVLFWVVYIIVVTSHYSHYGLGFRVWGNHWSP